MVKYSLPMRLVSPHGLVLLRQRELTCHDQFLEVLSTTMVLRGLHEPESIILDEILVLVHHLLHQNSLSIVELQAHDDFDYLVLVVQLPLIHDQM